MSWTSLSLHSETLPPRWNLPLRIHHVSMRMISSGRLFRFWGLILLEPSAVGFLTDEMACQTSKWRTNGTMRPYCGWVWVIRHMVQESVANVVYEVLQGTKWWFALSSSPLTCERIPLSKDSSTAYRISEQYRRKPVATDDVVYAYVEMSTERLSDLVRHLGISSLHILV